MSARTSSPTRIGGAVILVAVIAVVSASACLDRKLQPLNPCLVQGVAEEINVDTVDKVDLLFVVDDSPSMQAEQQALAQNFPRMAEILASGDQDGDGEEDFPPVRDLHLGVISTNMGGYGANSKGGCGDNMGLGDNGVMLTGVGDGVDNPGMCPNDPTGGKPFLAFQGNQDPTTFGQKFACIAQLGAGGCGFEQQLEAPLKALTPSSASQPRFFRNTSGHGDQANQGFLRQDSLLAVILVTDEDDCSVKKPILYSSGAGAPFNQVDGLNLRCAGAIGFQDTNGNMVKFNKNTLTRISRYVNGYLKLRQGNPDRFIFGAITGIPPNLEGQPYGQILQAEPMQLRERPDSQIPMGGGLPIHPSCTGLGAGASNSESVPPRRIVKVAQGIEDNGGNSVVTSICRQDFSRALQNIINKISEQLQTPCLPRELTRNSEGTVDCRVVEILPAEGDNSQCSQIPGREQIRMEGNRQVCRVKQIALDPNNPTAPSGSETGWYYDDFSSSVKESCGQNGQRIAFTTGDKPRSGTTVELECFQTVDSSSNEQCTVNTPCSCGGGTCTSDRFDNNVFQCDNQQTRTCQVACNTNADCLDQNLGGFICDTRDPAQTPLGPPPGNFEGWCVAPTCQSSAPGESPGSGGGGNMGGTGR